MKKVFSLALAAVAMLASSAASLGCLIILIDEPEAPSCLQD